MAESGATKKEGKWSEDELMTLTEVSRRTGISLPTLQKYKKRHPDRIPSEGEGRKQRYPEEALPVFEQLKKEYMARRGRPRKSKAKKSSKKKSAAKGGAGAHDEQQLMTLRKTAKEAGISYQTALRYVREQLDRIPHQMVGKRRKFPPEAVAAMKEIRGEAQGGRPPKRRKKKAAAKKGRRAEKAPSGDATLKRLAKSVEELESRIAALEQELKKPLKIEVKR